MSGYRRRQDKKRLYKGLGIAAAVLIMIVIGVLFKIAMPRFTKLQELIDRLNLVTREQLTGIMVTRAFSAETHEEERFEKANQDLTRTNLFVNRCMTFMMPVMMVIMNGISVLIVYSEAMQSTVAPCRSAI